MWINHYVFISCLDSHSDGTHSLQKIHWWGSDVHFSQSVRIKKQTHLHFGQFGVNFQQFFFFFSCFPTGKFRIPKIRPNIQFFMHFIAIESCFSVFLRAEHYYLLSFANLYYCQINQTSVHHCWSRNNQKQTVLMSFSVSATHQGLLLVWRPGQAPQSIQI